MPVNGGTRMLRARRKDINVKPNRRLDRKSSRGMLFENEELRMRTITINAEVEQGQHALKKLRKENEQLRREMWSLRDEYDKMERLLRKKETDEDSDGENSYSDCNYSQTDSDRDGEEQGDESAEREEDADATRAGARLGFGNMTTARAFDGLSVIDEQTEETTTQTTESANGRSSSANRTLNLVAPAAFRDECDEWKPFFGPACHTRASQRRKGAAPREGDTAFGAYPADWPDNVCTVRPSSPYPHAGSFQPSYQRRFQLLQELSPLVTRLPTSDADEGGWMIPGGGFLREDADADPSRDFDYAVIRDRSGPDVFISDVCAKKYVPEAACGGKGAMPPPPPPPEGLIADDGIIENVEAEIDKMDIGGKMEGGAGGESKKAVEESPAAKPKAGKRIGNRDRGPQGAVRDSVSCQNPGDKDFREATLDAEDMARADKASLFQSKLMVTLRTPKKVPQGCQPPGHAHPECRYAGGASCRLANGFAEERMLSPLLPVPSTVPEATENAPLNVRDIPQRPPREGPAAPATAEAGAASHGGVAPSKPIKIPPAPPPRTSSIVPETAPSVHRQTPGKERNPTVNHGDDPARRNPFLVREPLATSSPVAAPRSFLRGQNLSLDNLSRRRACGTSNEESSTEDIPSKKGGGRPRDKPHLNKSVSSPSFGTFLRRKASERSVSSAENGAGQPRNPFGGIAHNNTSVSSSSGLDAPIKCERRKRRVSIRFNKKVHPESGVADGSPEARRGSSGTGAPETKCGGRGRTRNRNEETDVTTSERERTNSLSSRASSGRRKLSTSSNRTYLNDEKIPWCGCWGNGCV